MALFWLFAEPRIAVADGLAVGVDRHVLVDVDAAVVGKQQQLADLDSKPSTVPPACIKLKLPLACTTTSGACPKRYRPSPSLQKLVRDQPEALENLAVETDLDAAARLGVGLAQRQIRGIQDFECAHDAGDFGVEPRAGVERRSWR